MYAYWNDTLAIVTPEKPDQTPAPEALAAGRSWASGFDTRKVDPDFARRMVDLGAPLTVHAAAGLGLIDELGRMLAADASLVDAKGGDGCTPLHFSRNITM